jgi:hypothetical protein
MKKTLQLKKVPFISLPVWYWVRQPSPQTQPLAAIIVSIVDEAHVNLAVFDAAGTSHGEQNVLLVQPSDPDPDENHCEWVPEQKPTHA